MAGNFEIRLDISGLSKSKASESRLKKVEGNPEAAEREPAPQARADRLIGGLKAVVVFDYAKKAGGEIAAARLSSIGEKYGNEALQNEVGNATSIASRLTSTALSVAVAASETPALGIATAAMALASKAITMYENEISWRERRREEDLENTRKAERLGIVSSQKSRRNY